MLQQHRKASVGRSRSQYGGEPQIDGVKFSSEEPKSTPGKERNNESFRKRTAWFLRKYARKSCA